MLKFNLEELMECMCECAPDANVEALETAWNWCKRFEENDVRIDWTFHTVEAVLENSDIITKICLWLGDFVMGVYVEQGEDILSEKELQLSEWRKELKI